MSHERVLPMRHVPRADRWHPTTAAELRNVPASEKTWLAWPDSLTERLCNHLGGPVQVNVLSERQGRLLTSEREHLAVRAHTARIREVQLEVRGEPYVVARTVFPDTTARVMDQALRHLGTRSLGSLLFGALRAPVRSREFSRMTPDCALWRALHVHLPEATTKLWARRALHLLQEQPLLVTEIFLPRLFATLTSSTPGSLDR